MFRDYYFPKCVIVRDCFSQFIVIWGYFSQIVWYVEGLLFPKMYYDQGLFFPVYWNEGLLFPIDVTKTNCLPS